MEDWGRASGKAPEKSLRLEALINHYVSAYLADKEREPGLTAICLFALTEKSLAASRLFAPSNARDLVNRRHRRLMENLKEEPVASSASAVIQQQAERLKELSRELKDSSGRQLKLVQSPRIARQLCRIFRLGDGAFQAWQQRSSKGAGGKATTTSSISGSLCGSSPPEGSPSLSPGPSPPPNLPLFAKRHKRKSPEKAHVGRSRFSQESCGEACPAGNNRCNSGFDSISDEGPMRRRRTSSSEEAEQQIGLLAGVAPVQLLCSSERSQDGSAIGITTAEAAAGAAAGAASPLVGMQDVAAPPLQAQQQQQFSTAGSARAAPDGGQAMDVDSSAGEAVEMLSWRLTGLLPPATTTSNSPVPLLSGAATAVAWPAPAISTELPPIPTLLLSPRQQQVLTLPQAAITCSPSKAHPWPLLPPTPASKENSGIEIAIYKPTGIGSSPGLFGRVPAAGAASHPSVPAAKCHTADGNKAVLQRGNAAVDEREAAAQDIVAADIMLLLSESAQATEDGCTTTPLPANRAPAKACSSEEHGSMASAAGESSPHGQSRQQQLRAVKKQPRRAAKPSQLAIPAGHYGVMAASRQEVERAAQQAREAGGQLSPATAFAALNGRGRAASILRPLLPAAVLQSAGLSTPCC